MNFLQWNPNQVNQESDSQYAADSQRAGGAGDPAIFPSGTANKLFYQLSTFVAAFAQALTNKGYTITDTNLSNLAGQLANVITATDLTPYASKSFVAATYAPLINAGLLGTPTAPTPATADDSGRLATTAFVQNQGYAPQSWVNAFFTPLSDFAWGNPSGTAGYIHLPNGLILQFGTGGASTGTVITFPVAFPNGFYQTMLTNIGPGGGSMDPRTLGCIAVSSSQFKVWVYDQTGAASSTNISWLAIGY